MADRIIKQLVRLLTLRRVDDAGGVGDAWRRLDMGLRIDPAIADCQASQSDIARTAFLLQQFSRNRRNEMTCIALAGQVERPPLILREGLVEVLQEGDEILGDLKLIENKMPVTREGQPGLQRLIDIQHVGTLVPAMIGQADGLVVIQGQRAVFLEHGRDAGTSGTAAQPDDERIRRRRRLRFHQPEKQLVLPGRVDRQIAGELRECRLHGKSRETHHTKRVGGDSRRGSLAPGDGEKRHYADA